MIYNNNCILLLQLFIFNLVIQFNKWTSKFRSNLSLLEMVPLAKLAFSLGNSFCSYFRYVEKKCPQEYQATIFDNKTTTLKIDYKLVNLGLWYSPKFTQGYSWAIIVQQTATTRLPRNRRLFNLLLSDGFFILQKCSIKMV